MTTVSREFLAALKTAKEPAYRIAQKARVNPSALSRLINGIDPLRENDPRILAVAKILGLKKEQVFVEVE